MTLKTALYLFSAFAVTYSLRVVPMLMIRKPIANRYVRSFLFYVPYVTLAAMTFPEVLYLTDSLPATLIPFLIAVAAALFTHNILVICGSACISSFLILLLF